MWRAACFLFRVVGGWSVGRSAAAGGRSGVVGSGTQKIGGVSSRRAKTSGREQETLHSAVWRLDEDDADNNDMSFLWVCIGKGVFGLNYRESKFLKCSIGAWDHSGVIEYPGRNGCVEFRGVSLNPSVTFCTRRACSISGV